MYFALALILLAAAGAAADSSVSVCRDATYAIPAARGAVCSGSGSAPAGLSCPLKGDTAAADCHQHLASYSGSMCAAREDAVCELVNGRSWGCVFPSVGCSKAQGPAVTEAEPVAKAKDKDQAPKDKDQAPVEEKWKSDHLQGRERPPVPGAGEWMGPHKAEDADLFAGSFGPRAYGWTPLSANGEQPFALNWMEAFRVPYHPVLNPLHHYQRANDHLPVSVRLGEPSTARHGQQVTFDQLD